MEENEAKVCSCDCKPNSIFRRIWNRLRYCDRNTINHFKKSNMESWAEIDVMSMRNAKKSPPLSSEVRKYQKDAITAAKDLNYGKEVIYKLEHAKTIGEISRIMITAREGV